MHYRIIPFGVIFFLLILGDNLFAQDTGQLHEDFAKSVKKVRQYPQNDKRIAELAFSYQAVTKADEEALGALKASGQPEIWYDVYRIQENMKWRQDQLLSLPEPIRNQISFNYVDMSDDILKAKNRAEAYFYAHAKMLLEQEKPEAARMAYHDLVRLAGLAKEYKDMDALIRRAVLYGATDIQYELYNRTGWDLQSEIIETLSVAVYAHRRERQEKPQADLQDLSFPFSIRVYLTELKVSPDRVKKSNYAEERDIFRNGVVIDTIRCNVDQFKQVKGAVLTGRIDIYDETLKTVINTIPLTAESMFIHSYATLKGNPDAAGAETRLLLAQKEVKFPSNEAIVMDAVEEFMKQAIQVLLPL